MNKIYLTEERFPSKKYYNSNSTTTAWKVTTERWHEDTVANTKHICEYLEQCVKTFKKNASYGPQGVQYDQKKRVRLHHIIPTDNTVGTSTLNTEPRNGWRKDTQRTTRVIVALTNMKFFLRDEAFDTTTSVDWDVY